jgi:hypothetical protein
MPPMAAQEERAPSPRFSTAGTECVCPATAPLTRTSLPWRRDMKVKLCARCPYTPHDLAGHYDPLAAIHACATCDREQETFARHDRREIHWRQPCSTIPSSTNTSQDGVAPSVTGSLASSATIPGERPSVQRSASITSRPAVTSTTNGCGDFAPPDDRRAARPAEFPWRSLVRDKETAW